VGTTLKATIAVIPALSVFVLTLAISLVGGHIQELFLTRPLRSITMRFLIATFALALPILLMPKLVALIGEITANHTIVGELVKTTGNANTDLSLSVTWVLRPVQGISLSMILAERFLSFVEFSTGASYGFILTRLSLFVIGGALSSLFLSTVWALDDLGMKIYNNKTGEVRMAGTSIGTILPLITAAIGISNLFHTNTTLEALIDISQIVLVLYPPYALYTIIHHEFIARRRTALLKELAARTIETKAR
jgi:hypothetical protein